MGAVLDIFDRTVSNGWGTTPTGHVWTLTGTASEFNVSASTGIQTHTTVNGMRTMLLNTEEADGTVTVDAMVPVVPSGAGITIWAVGRATDTLNYYVAYLAIAPGTGSTNLIVAKRVTGSLTTIQSSINIGTHSAGHWWRVVFDFRGTALRAKAWNTNNQSDPGWQVTTTDATLTTGTLAGALSRLETGNTNTLPVNVSFDNFEFTPVITATQQDTWPPRALVTVNNLFIGDEVEVYRVVGGERTLLRGGTDPGVADPAFLVIDAELPFGVPVHYEAVVNGAGAVEASTEATTYTLDGGKVAVTDAISGSAAEVVILAWDEKAHQRQATVFKVGGRNVVVSGDLGMWEGNIELFTETTSSRDNLMDVLTNATEGIIQIRQPGGYDGVDSYVAVTGVTERRFSQDGTDERRIITLDAVEVEGWAPDLEARGYTYEDLEAAYAGLTYADLAGDHGTYLDLAQADLS